MPNVIDYPAVQERMAALGLRSLYYNSGAFGFPNGAVTSFVGWIGPDDPSIRAEAMAHARRVAPPYEQNLADLAARAWELLFPGPAWILPKSNWAYELDFGSKAWMPQALKKLGIDPSVLQHQTNAPALEFSADKRDSFRDFSALLLQNLVGSDFALAWPAHCVTCTLHHHKQIWWVTDEVRIFDGLNRVYEEAAA